MILYLPAALFFASLLMAYGSAGRRRQAATIGTVVAAAWSLALLVDLGSVAWAIGPIVASLLLARPGKRVNSSFEGLTRRVSTIAVALLVALLFAARLPVGENPLLLSAVPWFLGALGAAWFSSPIDQRERLQGQALMVAAAAAVILAAVPAGPLTASLAGAMALMPLAGERWRLPGPLQLPASVTLLGLAAVAVAVAGIGSPIARIAFFDLSVDVSGAILLAIAVLLVAGAALTPIGSEWAALLGVLAVSASAPSLRWAALGALVAVATVLAEEGDYRAWIAFGILGLTPVVQAQATSTSSAHILSLASFSPPGKPSTVFSCCAAYSSSWVRVHFHSRTGAMIFRSGARVWKVTSKRTWSFPLPVHPCATATAPWSRATRTISWAMRGRPRAVASGYFPS